MALDLTTLYAVAALGALIAGVVHLIPWATGRFGVWAAYWGFGHLILGTTALSGILYDQFMLGTWVIRVGNPAAILSYVLILAGARTFERPDAPVLPLFLTGAVVAIPLVLSVNPAHFPWRVAYLSMVRPAMDLLVVTVALRLALREKVHTGWIVATLFLVTVPIFLGRGYYALQDKIGSRPTGMHDGPAAWLAATLIALITFRAFSFLILQAERSQKMLAEQMCRDPLTGARNRLGFEHLLGTLSGNLCLLMIDVDHFKALNDRHGHAMGDAVLRRLADVAHGVLDGKCAVVRWGGDEFICVLPGYDTERSRAVAEAIATGFTDAVRGMVPDPSGLTLSIGYAAGPIDAGIDTLLVQADMDMYAVKRRRAVSSLTSAHRRASELAGSHAGAVLSPRASTAT